MAIDQGGRSKQLEDDSPGPWTEWPETDRAERAIRFIEEYCVPSAGYTAGKPLRLASFQREWIREVLAPGVRSAALLLPRGNGKTGLLGALAVWAVFDPDEGGRPEVPIIATTVGQAIRTSFGIARGYVENHEALRTRSKSFTSVNGARIDVPSTHGSLFPVADKPDGLQGLSPSLAIADELGFLSIESWDALLLASGKRPRSLVCGIGSPGPSRESALYQLRQRWLEGGKIPGFRFTEFTAPEGCALDDEGAWRIANPALAEGFKDIDAMRMLAATAPEAEFRLYQLAQWVSGTDCWLGSNAAGVWKSLGRARMPVAGAPAWVGVDVALKHDSTAVVLVQNAPEGFAAWARIWTPEEGRPLDVTDVMHHLRGLAAQYDVRAVSYDPRFFDVPANQLADEGLPMIEIPQSVERMTRACGRAFDLITQGKVTHDGDALFGQHVLNAVPRYNSVGFTLAKAKARGKIDACIALCLALDRAEQMAEKPRTALVTSW